MVTTGNEFMDPYDDLPVHARISLAWQPAARRLALQCVYALDARMGGVVANAREPMLAQIRLAWWRDRLNEPADRRPAGEPLLTMIGEGWVGREPALVPLVDAWEALLCDTDPQDGTIAAFADGRGHALAAFAQGCGDTGIGAALAGRRWALADLASRMGETPARDAARKLARTMPDTRRFSRSLRGLAVLDALAARALSRGQQMTVDRSAALLAWRVGMTGR